MTCCNMVMQKFRASVWQEGDLFVAQCLEIDLAGQGESEEGALAALAEVIQLNFMPPVATVLPKVSTLEVEAGAPPLRQLQLCPLGPQ